MGTNKVIAFYLLFYGFFGTLYNAYLIYTSNQTLQVTLIIASWTMFSMLVFTAGYSQYRQWRGHSVFVFLVQLAQVGSVEFSQFYLRLRCGASFNVKYETGIYKWDFNFTDLASAFSWKMPPPPSSGLNLIAVIICTLLLIKFFDK